MIQLSPLYSAVITGNRHQAEILLEAGADTEEANRNGLTPLYVAVKMCSAQMAQLLLVAGANVNKPMYAVGTSMIIATPLSNACDKPDPTMISLLIAQGASRFPMFPVREEVHALVYKTHKML